MILMDVRVSPRPVHMVVEGFGRAAQSLPRSFEVLGGSACVEAGALLLERGLIHDSKAAAVQTNVGVAACAICIVNICSTGCRKDTHYLYNVLIILFK